MPESKTRRHKARVQEMNAFRKTCSDLGNTLEVLRNQLQELNREIRADKAGKKEFEDQLALLKRQRDLLNTRFESNQKWAKEFGKKGSST